jgi:transglutaminase-like putative cysteine protease
MGVGGVNGIYSSIVKELFPIEPYPSLPKPKDSLVHPLVDSLLPNIHQIKMNYLSLRIAEVDGREEENDYGMYLQYPNAEIKALALSIVEPSDTNDEKAYKIMRWVQDNIQYRSDIESYGLLEFWVLPTVTVKKGYGDCEDGAFLIHSLMLNAGVPWNRVRTYGGIVVAGVGASTGGHGWTAYKREIDDEWVVVDWSYYPSQDPIDERVPMPEDERYIDDYFYVNVVETVESPIANNVKNPPALAGYSNRSTFAYTKGQRVDISA